MPDFAKKPKELLGGGAIKFLRTCNGATILECYGSSPEPSIAHSYRLIANYKAAWHAFQIPSAYSLYIGHRGYLL